MRAAKAAKDLHGVCSSLADQLRDYLSPRVNAESCELVYLSDQVLPLLVNIAGALCAEQPKDPRAFLLHWAADALLLSPDLRERLREAAPPKDFAVRRPDGRPTSGGRRRPRALTSGSTTSLGGPPSPSKPSGLYDGFRDTRVTTAPCATAAAAAAAAAMFEQQQAINPTPQTVVHETASPNISPTQRCTEMAKSAVRKGSKRMSLVQGLLCGAGGVPAVSAHALQGEAHGLPHLKREEVIEALKRVPMMQGMSDTDLHRLAEVAYLNKYEEDQPIVSYGQLEESLHVMVSGVCRVSVPQTVGQINSGDFFGESGLRMIGATSTTMVVAMGGGATTLSIRRRDFEGLDIMKGIGKRQRKVASNWTVEESFVGRAMEPRASSVEYCEACGLPMLSNYEMTEVDKAMILNAVKNNKVLGDVMLLSEEQCERFVNAVYLVRAAAGTEVFKRGHKGTAFFIVQEGYLESKNEAWAENRGGSMVPGMSEQSSHVQFRLGDTFGELALMYDEPRQATVVALMDTKLWVMPQIAFRDVIQISVKAKLAEFEKLLHNVPAFLSAIDRTLFSMLASISEEIAFSEGQIVCKKGEDRGLFFMVLEGTCAVKEDGETGRVFEEGEWFGEEQVVNDTDALQTVVVESDTCFILVLDHDSLNVVRAATEELQQRKALSKTELFRKHVYKVISSLKGLRLFGHLKATKLMTEKTTVDLKRCDVVGGLGEGSFGSVWLIRDASTRREYALKAMDKYKLREEDQETMVSNERRLLAQLESKFIVRLHKSYEDNRCVYFMLDAVYGGELFDVYTERELWGDVPCARFYIANVALGLQHLHSKRIVWRDLKLENCLVDDKGYLKLADMGIAKLVIGKTYTVCGTADYFAPETLRQLGHNRAADWWAAGVLLFIMIVGRSPFDAPDVSQIYKNIIKGMAKVDFPRSCPQEARDIILALCRKKPEDRITMQKGGVANLKHMPFFAGQDWDEVEARMFPAPWLPPAPDYEKIKGKSLSLKIEINHDELREIVDEEDDNPLLLARPESSMEE